MSMRKRKEIQKMLRKIESETCFFLDCDMEGEIIMVLSETDGQFFYQLWFPLLGYASCACGLVETPSELVTPRGVDAIIARTAADELWNHMEIIDDYLAQRNDLPAEHREIINSWKRRVRGNFYLERHLKHGSILIDAESKNVYQVKGIISSWKEMIGSYPLPVYMETTLIPFQDVIIPDGLIIPKPFRFGKSVTQSLAERYQEAKRAGEIIRNL